MRDFRLMVVDDDPNLADLMQCVAGALDFSVQCTCNIEEIADSYDRFRPDAVVLDILMPDIDGFEILRLLHARKSRCCILLVSAQNEYLSMAARMAEGLNLRIYAALPKPLDIEVLQDTFAGLKHQLSLKNAC